MQVCKTPQEVASSVLNNNGINKSDIAKQKDAVSTNYLVYYPQIQSKS